MNPHDLRFTDTNSADDSKGKTWGLEGDLFWYLAGGAFISVVVMLLLFSAYRFPFTTALLISAIPLVLALTYVFGFRQGKPPRYDLDYFEFWMSGKGFGPQPQTKLQHPLEVRHV
jgi:hypothetical protein